MLYIRGELAIIGGISDPNVFFFLETKTCTDARPAHFACEVETPQKTRGLIGLNNEKKATAK